MQNQQTTTIEYSAPGKLILSGEHSVVYNKNAIAMGLDLRTNVKVNIIKKSTELNPHFKVHFYDENIRYEYTTQELQNILQILDPTMPHISFQEYQELNLKNKIIIQNQQTPQKHQDSKEIFSYILYYIFQYTIKEQNISVKTYMNQLNSFQFELISTSTLPISKGLGSSASFNSALAASLYHTSHYIIQDNQTTNKIFQEESIDKLQKKVNEMSFELEKIYHGTPSGIDNFVATYGGLVLYNKLSENPKRLEKIELPYNIYLIDSNVEKNTKKAVGKVREVCQNQQLQAIGTDIINVISNVTDRIENIIEQYSQNKLQKPEFMYNFEELIRINHSLLTAFQLSNTKIDEITSITQKYGIPCKITGAGQGGFCLGFVPINFDKEKLDQFQRDLKTRGFSYMNASIAKQGLQKQMAPKL